MTRSKPQITAFAATPEERLRLASAELYRSMHLNAQVQDEPLAAPESASARGYLTSYCLSKDRCEKRWN